MSEELKVRTKAEARFFRAFAYLTLTQYFAKGGYSYRRITL